MIPMFSMESAIDPAGNTDVMMAVVLSLVGLCLEFGAYTKAYNLTMSWLRKKSGGARGQVSYPPNRTQVAIGTAWGGIFTLFGLVVLIPVCGWFGIFWTLLAAIITGLHVWQLLVKKYPTSKKDQDEVSRQLNLLEDLRAAGLIDDQEYWERRQKILEEL